jgi:hypothetical protein
MNCAVQIEEMQFRKNSTWCRAGAPHVEVLLALLYATSTDFISATMSASSTISEGINTA